MTVAEMRKSVFGVAEINSIFLKQIAELTFQHTKLDSLRCQKLLSTQGPAISEHAQEPPVLGMARYMPTAFSKWFLTGSK